jgi:hypothetical protein
VKRTDEEFTSYATDAWLRLFRTAYALTGDVPAAGHRAVHACLEGDVPGDQADRLGLVRVRTGVRPRSR